MTVREEIAKKYCGGGRKIGMILADRILSIKVGDRTLEELIELYEQGKLRVEAENQGLPENPYPQDYQSSNGDFYDAVQEAQQDMLTPKDGNVWVKVKTV